MVLDLNKRKLLALILVLGCLACAVLAVVVFAKGGGRPEDARDGIVWIRALLYDNQSTLLTGGTGTGWAIGKPGKPAEYIVTNGHVVAYAYEVPKAEPNSYSGEVSVVFSDAANDFMMAKVVYYSPPDEKDIAILKLPMPTDKRVPLRLRASDTADVGDHVYALGYPGISDEMQANATHDKDDITMTSGIISKRVFPKGVSFEAFQLDVSINAGNSGGPLVDERGFVVGINTMGASDAATGVSLGMNYAILSDELIKILDSEGLPYAVQGGGGWSGYVLAAMALACLAGAAFVFKVGTAAASLPASSASPAPLVPPAGTPCAGAGRRPIVRGLNGIFAGQKIFIGDARATLGRDSSRCNLVYPADTPGISALHCEVWYDAAAGCFFLQDSNSTYGTFLGNGKKLAPNLPQRLNSGDLFYLSSEENRFTVNLEL